MLGQSPLFCDALHPGGGQREGPVLLCGEAEQGLPGTVSWGLGDAQRAGWVGTKGGRDSAHKGSEGPRMCIPSHGVTVSMSPSENKQRSMHEAQKLDNLSIIFFCLEDGLASQAKRTNRRR